MFFMPYGTFFVLWLEFVPLMPGAHIQNWFHGVGSERETKALLKPEAKGG